MADIAKPVELHMVSAGYLAPPPVHGELKRNRDEEDMAYFGKKQQLKVHALPRPALPR